jgi:TolB-like protein
LILAGLASVLLFKAYLNILVRQPTDSAVHGVGKIGVAVLPFDTLVSNKEESYFADGIQEAILTNLANVSALKVISRGSVTRYRDSRKNEQEIGKTLGVAYVLEGSVQKTADHVRLNAQVVETRTAATIWAQQYDRKLDDLFGVESELAQAIVSQLKAKLSPDEKAAIEARPTTDMLAYDLYLRARESFFQDNCENALNLLQQAVTRDPHFALAHTLLAEVHLYMYRFNGDRSTARLDRAKQAAETAVRLAPKLPQSHLAEAQYFYYGLRDYQRALAELHTARSLGGEQAEFVDLSALIERRLGYWNDAIKDGERASELDPQNPFVINELVESYISVHRFADADRVADKAIKAAVTRSGHLWALRTDALLGMGRIDEARAVIESSPEGMDRLNEQVWVALFARDFPRALQLLSEATPAERKTYDVAFFEGVIARAQGDFAKARASFQLGRDRVVAQLGERPNDPDLISKISVADAGLGYKEIAIQEAKKAVELCPMSRDAVDGASYESMLAMTYAWIGDRDAAIAGLEKMVTLPRGPEWGELRYSPLWDDLRNDARFNRLLTQAAFPPVYH